ncbi:MAG: hypothetical protein ACKVT1_15180, partial [Dehalococcoidia bacterium]
LFIAIPAAGAGLIAWLTELFPRFWWRQRWPTAAAALPAVPSMIIFFPLTVVAIVVGGLWAFAMRWPVLRRFPAWKPARVAAMVVFVLITGLGLADLIGDMEDIL